MTCKSVLLLGAAAAISALAGAGAAEARDQIRIVGSSTVFPFSTAVAEQFGKTTKFKTPVVESTGTGGGLKLFCAGLGVRHPDIANASRRIKASEVKDCERNGVKEIVEVKVGFDGIVLANSKSAPKAKLTREQLFLAVARQAPQNGKLVANSYVRWSEIDPSLPNQPIEVLGPPPTSGTRDAFVELVMERACGKFPEIKAIEGDKAAYKEACSAVREDGRYVEAGENDNLIVHKLAANPAAFGIFGYSFLEQNLDKLQGSAIDGVEPTYERISSGEYPVSRSLYVYVKKAHADTIPGIREYVAEFTSEKAFGPDGYLADKGLIALPDAERNTVRETARSMTHLTM